MRTILVTGFGPFPGAPFNPTEALVRRLAKLRRWNLRLVPHVFETSYAAVDRELPPLIAKHKPDALLMFGLHGRAKTLRIETLARNSIGRVRDVSGTTPKNHSISPGAAHIKMASPGSRLARAARRAGVPAVMSRDAGHYLCNYLCWRGTETAKAQDLRIAAFIHVPPIGRKTLRRKSHILTPAGLERAAGAILAELVHCLGSGAVRH
jgi:pyroglutamyl-peptidase